jgi:plastocyanin
MMRTTPRRPGRLVALCVACMLPAACGDGTGPAGVRDVTVSAVGSTVRVGESLQLTATAVDGAGSVVNSPPRWTTSAAAIAAVTGTGLVTGLARGEATITATVQGVEGSIRLTVAAATDVVVSMPGFSFVPFATVIPVGGTVIFDFPAEPHNVIFERNTGAPQDIQVTANRTVSRRFNTAGQFPYDCTLHPGMSGTVTVR